MAPPLFSFGLLALFAVFTPCIFADECKAYTDSFGKYHKKLKCDYDFCCGSCNNRYCCSDSFRRLSGDKQEDCNYSSHVSVLPIVVGVSGFIIIALIFVLCCVCPCCCLYKCCRRPRPVIATTHHTTVVTTNTPQQPYPQQPPMAPQPYQGAQYSPYQPVPVQPGYGAQPMPYQGTPYVPGPPPTYQEATGPYPAAPMPYSQAAFTPGQPSYPLQPPGPSPSHPQPQPSAPQTDFSSQPAYNPNYVSNKM